MCSMCTIKDSVNLSPVILNGISVWVAWYGLHKVAWTTWNGTTLHRMVRFCLVLEVVYMVWRDKHYGADSEGVVWMVWYGMLWFGMVGTLGLSWYGGLPSFLGVASISRPPPTIDPSVVRQNTRWRWSHSAGGRLGTCWGGSAAEWGRWVWWSHGWGWSWCCSWCPKAWCLQQPPLLKPLWFSTTQLHDQHPVPSTVHTIVVTISFSWNNLGLSDPFLLVPLSVLCNNKNAFWKEKSSKHEHENYFRV